MKRLTVQPEHDAGRGRGRRRLARLFAALGAGLAVTVALAGACALWSLDTGTIPGGYGAEDVSAADLGWLRSRPDLPGATGWSDEDLACMVTWRATGFGTSVRAYDRAGIPALTGLPLVGKLFHNRLARPPQVTRWRCGWPLPALEAEQFNIDRPRVRHGLMLPPDAATSSFRRTLPYRPLWTGLAFDTLLFATIILLAGSARAAFVRGRRRRRGRCAGCGYPATPGGVCPECGDVTPCAASGRSTRTNTNRLVVSAALFLVQLAAVAAAHWLVIAGIPDLWG